MWLPQDVVDAYICVDMVDLGSIYAMQPILAVLGTMRLQKHTCCTKNQIDSFYYITMIQKKGCDVVVSPLTRILVYV